MPSILKVGRSWINLDHVVEAWMVAHDGKDQQPALRVILAAPDLEEFIGEQGYGTGARLSTFRGDEMARVAAALDRLATLAALDREPLDPARDGLAEHFT